ncbi:hypothetical protein MRB53_002484 [Persea americana]|uniref:Uncharacterized protein n=1 Tax=Persea americana TaxID=3435 RepID=A0ACC2MVH9_PERAE|nr:hypothetical protein MRB53_002484 [Persea americana]
MELELLKGGALRIDRGEVGFSSSDEDLPEKKVAAGEGFEAHVHGKGEEDAGAARGVNEGGNGVDFYEVGEAKDERPESRNLKEQQRDHGGLCP